jgi:hypothetical protein
MQDFVFQANLRVNFANRVPNGGTGSTEGYYFIFSDGTQRLYTIGLTDAGFLLNADVPPDQPLTPYAIADGSFHVYHFAVHGGLATFAIDGNVVATDIPPLTTPYTAGRVLFGAAEGLSRSSTELKSVCYALATACYAAPTFAFSGFFAPVSNLPVANVVKAGSAIPVKFSLGGDFGLDVVAAGFPVSVSSACESGVPTSAIEQTTTSGASGLSYDPGTQSYTYVWKTSKAWDGCRQLTLKLSDGSEHVASFRFK